MRKLVILAGICAAGLAWARPPDNPEKTDVQGEFQGDKRSQGSGAVFGGEMTGGDEEEALRTGIQEQGRSADTSGRIQQEQEEVTMEQGQEDRPALTLENSYEVEGEVLSVEPEENKVVVSREDNLPPLELSVVEGSQIQREGNEANLEDLQPGDEVRANFNVAMDKPIAIKVESNEK